ncbi:MAG: hypothetical protein Q4G64_07570 [bacterium]|nr:hypothetical protein [bacterium]
MTESAPEGLEFESEEVEREFEPAEEPQTEEYRAEGPDVVPFETDPVDHAEQRAEVEFDEEPRA